MLTPDDARMHAGITSFRLCGRISAEENRAVAARLLNDYRIFTVPRTGLASGACVRVTPALFNSMGMSMRSLLHCTTSRVGASLLGARLHKERTAKFEELCINLKHAAHAMQTRSFHVLKLHCTKQSKLCRSLQVHHV